MDATSTSNGPRIDLKMNLKQITEQQTDPLERIQNGPKIDLKQFETNYGTTNKPETDLLTWSAPK